MHVRSKFILYQNRVNWAIFTVLNSILLGIHTDLKSRREYAFVKACFIWSGSLQSLKYVER